MVNKMTAINFCYEAAQLLPYIDWSYFFHAWGIKARDCGTKEAQQLKSDAIALLNDAVGGVSVNVTDDFSQVDPDIKMGQMTLSGKQALTYVQARRFVSDQLNLSRIDRQMEYMKGFVSALRTKASSSSSGMLKVYNAAAEYVVTDCSVSVLNRLLEDYGNYSLNNVLLLPGENVLGESHYEFYVDEEAADELILQLFYKPID